MKWQAVLIGLAMLVSGAICGNAEAGPPQLRGDGGRGAMGYKTWPLPEVQKVKKYRRAALQGSAPAQFYLSMMYNSGYGVSQDHAEAVKWLRKAAQQGLAKAQNNLGGMYNSGLGVPPDYAEAVKWFRKAAELGDRAAQKNLAAKYAKGLGVEQNYSEAYVWASIAVLSGNQRASDNRDLAASNLTSEELSAAKKRAANLIAEIQLNVQGKQLQ